MKSRRLTKHEKALQAENTVLRLKLEGVENYQRHLQAKLQEKVDTSMIEARTKLASQIGQLVEATSKAVVWLVGKEQL